VRIFATRRRFCDYNLSVMSESERIIVGSTLLALEGIFFGVLNEMPACTSAEMRIWFTTKLGLLLRYLGKSPSAENRKKHINIALGLIATVVFALVPLGYSMMESHPCGAWFWWTLSLLFAAYSFWSITPISRWARLIVLTTGTVAFLFYGQRSLYSGTELDFFFVNPGVFLVRGTGEQLLLVTGENTHRPLFSAQMILQDMVTSRAVPNESDLAKRVAMIKGSMIEKDYPEIGPTFLGDQIQWRPIDVNNQEYSIQARYRIGDKAFLSTEEIRIVNIGSRFVSAGRSDSNPVWQFSVTVRNQANVVLMHCVDPRFPRDARWIAGPACFPGAKYGPLQRSLCARCFGRGLEFVP